MAHQAPLGFSRQEYWSMLPFPQGNFATERSNPGLLLSSRFFFFNFLKYIYFSWRLITLQYCGGFCHTLTWITHRYTCVPHPEPHSHLPPHRIPLGCCSAPALSALFHAPNLDWSSISHLVIYMFQCCSLILSHPLLLHRIQKCVLYICVSFAVSHTGLWLPSF